MELSDDDTEQGGGIICFLKAPVLQFHLKNFIMKKLFVTSLD